MSDSQSQEKVEAKGQNAIKVSQPRGADAAKESQSGKKIKQNIPFIIIMFKGSLPMTICLAMLQSTVVAKRYTVVGYIMAMIAFFNFAMLPRAKYLEALVFNIIATCFGSALSLLAIWCGIKAREHTTPVGSTAAYNSSQSAVCAIWFFFSQWMAGTVRAKIPLLQTSVYFFSVLTMITMTYAPRFHTMEQGIGLMVELLEIFFIAFGVATGVSLLIFPITTRTILFKKHAAYFGAMRGFMKKKAAYYQSFQAAESLSQPSNETPQPKDDPIGASDSTKKHTFPAREALFASLNGLVALHTEIYNDTVYAKREIAYGKLNGDDLHQLFKAFRAILTPMVGLRTMIEVFDRLAPEDSTGQTTRESFDVRANEKSELRLLWSRVISAMHGPFAEIGEIIDQGLEHAAVVLEYLPKPKRGNDEEAQGGLKPGDPTFTQYMDRKVQEFHSRRSEFLSAWARERDALRRPGTQSNSLDQQHVYVVLHMEHLIHSIAVAVYDLVLFADLKSRDGTMARKRLLYPSLRKISTLVGNTLGGNPDFSLETAGEHLDGKERGFKGKTNIQSKARDPQHLPPRNAWERYSNYLRAVPKLLKSKESTFGFRLALAAFSAGILAYLERTWQFYYDQKLIWTLIVILVSTNVASGESTFKLAARAIGTVFAMVISFVVWYIVDGHPAGVLVFTWLTFFALDYGFVKVPKFFVVWLCILVTVIATIGSSLQSAKLGHAALVATGQIDYPIYENAPYRLATVLAGCVIAYFWTLFPYPITDRSLLGEKLGDILHLLAKFHDCGHSIASFKMRGKEGDMALKTSPGRKLQKVQHRLFHEIMTLIPALKMHSLFQKFEFPIGGRFPANRYMAIMHEMTNIMSYINLLTHSTRSWPTTLLPSSASNTPQEHDTAILFASMAVGSHDITSALTLLSAAVKYGIPLPPYFQAPPIVDYSPLWNKLSTDIQQEQAVTRDRDEEAVYSAWAVMHIVGDMVNSALARMVVEVRELVGEVDFESDLKD